MKQIVLTAILMTAISAPAMASLQVSARDADVGKNCYSERNNIKLYKLISPDFWEEDDTCTSAYDELHFQRESMCWLGYTNGALYVCLYDPYNEEEACKWSSAWEPRGWYNDGNNRVRELISTETESIAKYTCTVEPVYEYGCATGYYKSGGGDDSSMICSKCPTPGTSYEANIHITDCYVPSGSGYNDGTGTFNVSGNCYYKQ